MVHHFLIFILQLHIRKLRPKPPNTNFEANRKKFVKSWSKCWVHHFGFPTFDSRFNISDSKNSRIAILKPIQQGSCRSPNLGSTILYFQCPPSDSKLSTPKTITYQFWSDWKSVQYYWGRYNKIGFYRRICNAGSFLKKKKRMKM